MGEARFKKNVRSGVRQVRNDVVRFTTDRKNRVLIRLIKEVHDTTASRPKTAAGAVYDRAVR